MSTSLPPESVVRTTLPKATEIGAMIDAAIRKVFELDVITPEDTGEVSALHSDTVAVVREVLEYLAPLSSGEISFAPDAPAVPADPDAPQFGDLAFMAYLSLAAKLGALEQGPESKQKWEVLDLCSGARREALRSLCGIGNSLPRQPGAIRYDEFLYDEAMQGVVTRRAYVRFREEIQKSEPKDKQSAAVSLRRCASSIAKLRGRECYAFMRTQDRTLVHEAQHRIRSWLGTVQGNEEDFITARRIWQDISNQCEIMFAINNRPELREHDRKTLAKALRMLEGRHSQDSLAPVIEYLEPVRGRSETLDELIDSAIREPGLFADVVQNCLRVLDGSSKITEITSWSPPSVQRVTQAS
ncbi:MAG: hypothetical protein U0165_11340 [Polyangiaceae bacterium]